MPLTNAQKQAKHRLAVKERMAALTEALEWAISDIEARATYTRANQFGHCLQRAKEALEGSKGTQNTRNPTQRG